MDINTDHDCEICGADWRGGPICPVCDFEPQADDKSDGPAETDDWSGGFAENH